MARLATISLAWAFLAVLIDQTTLTFWGMRTAVTDANGSALVLLISAGVVTAIYWTFGMFIGLIFLWARRGSHNRYRGVLASLVTISFALTLALLGAYHHPRPYLIHQPSEQSLRGTLA
jgi:hypothetical protein